MKGFTLVEVLVTITVASIISGFLIVNFSRARTDVSNSILLVVDAIRSAQAQALSGSLSSGLPRCGFGVRFVNATTYALYVGPSSQAVNCALQDRRYNGGTDQDIRTFVLPNLALTFNPLPPDIFFEPPDPTTYVNNVATEGVEALIYIKNNGSTNCPSVDCRIIHVSTSGLIRTE